VPHDHRYWLPEGGRWEFFWISMSGQEAVRVHRAIQATSGPVLKLKPETIEHIADCCLRLIVGQGEAPGAASAIAYEAVGTLYDDVFGSQSAMWKADEASIRRVVDHILANLDARLSVADLADVAGFSRAYFTRMFTASEGVPPAEFVLRERMRRAARLLATHTMPVKEISAACGFDDPNYFAKVFRRAFGTSPTTFRMSGANEVPLGAGLPNGGASLKLRGGGMAAGAERSPSG
jgi:AraC-like DNA-binding protein